MCTLIVVHRLVPGAPLVVAANRDEYLDRPSEGPELRMTADGLVVAPRDLREGGTWLGLNARGVFAAVTNLRCPEPDPDRRSRGLLVMDALSASSAAESAERLGRLAEQTYNPFNLVVADSREAFLLTYRETVSLQTIGPGVHVVGNTHPDDRGAPKVKRILERATKAATHPRHSVLRELSSVCSEHDSPESPLGDACVHADVYGTKSSTLLMLADSESSESSELKHQEIDPYAPNPATSLLYADGPPCRTEYRDFTSLLTELSRRARYGSGETSVRENS